MATRELMTAEEFADLSTADNENYELVDGELIPLSSPIPLHTIIRDELVFLIRSYFKKHPIGGSLSETDCRINDETVRRPALSIFLGDRWRLVDSRRIPIPFAPNIAIEVLSPSEHAVDLTRKVRDYLGAGSEEVWMLDHENSEIQVRSEAGIRILNAADVLETPLLPGFTCNIAELLAGDSVG